MRRRWLWLLVITVPLLLAPVWGNSVVLYAPDGTRTRITTNNDGSVVLTRSATGQVFTLYPAPLAADPAAPIPGAIWYNYTEGRFKVHAATGITRLCTADDPC